MGTKKEDSAKDLNVLNDCDYKALRQIAAIGQQSKGIMEAFFCDSSFYGL